VGSVMLGKHNPDTNEEEPAPFELVRLAMPRRVYTQSHVDFMIEMLGYLQAYIAELPGYAFDYQPKVLRHFNATFKRLSG
jgi:tryptophanase